MITVNLFLTMMTVALLLACIMTMNKKQSQQIINIPQPQSGTVIVGHPLEPVLGIKVATKEAGRAIIWAESMGYQIGWDWYNGAGNVYIVFLSTIYFLPIIDNKS